MPRCLAKASALALCSLPVAAEDSSFFFSSRRRHTICLSDWSSDVCSSDLYPGGAEVVNMQPPAALIKKGVHALPCIGDGRQSGTSASPSILNASPEAAAGGGLALVRTGDKVRIDLKAHSANILISDVELKKRRAELEKHPFPYPKSQTPWQQIQREMVAQFDEGMVLKPAVKYQRI